MSIDFLSGENILYKEISYSRTRNFETEITLFKTKPVGSILLLFTHLYLGFIHEYFQGVSLHKL
jgi:hypothetical protein